jgi:hypothetical protein
MAFLGGTETWRDGPADLTGAVYDPVRLTWSADPVTGRLPSLSTSGMGWHE